MPAIAETTTTQTTSTFRWDDAWTGLGGPPDGDGRVNITDRIVDRHVREGRGDEIAIRWIARDDVDDFRPVDITYEALSRRVNRFAGALHHIGVSAGEGVATLMGRVPELYVAALGSLKAGAVYSPLFAAFEPDPIAQRLRLGKICVLVTTPTLFRRKVRSILDLLPDLRTIIVAGATEDAMPHIRLDDGHTIEVHSYGFCLGSGHDTFEAADTTVESPALLQFTSGPTGLPKGAVHVHGAVLAHHATSTGVFDLHSGDTYWCTADPGRLTDTSYGVIAPLSCGATMVVDEADFDAGRWYEILMRCAVDVLFTTPAAIRMLERVGRDAAPAAFPHLRLVATVGEPLDAAAVEWAADVFGAPVLDTWSQTETGAITIAQSVGRTGKPGSMGRPVPGTEVPDQIVPGSDGARIRSCPDQMVPGSDRDGVELGGGLGNE